MNDLVTVGDFIGDAEDFIGEEGCVTEGGSVFAAVSGLKREFLEADERVSVTVVTAKGASGSPGVGSVVLARVTRLSRLQANCDVLAVDGQLAGGPAKGIVRSQDVRSFEIDSVDILSCFRPGDIIRADVVSGGWRGGLLLSTARPSCGVVVAQSTRGGTLEPIAWNAMRCSASGRVERRKTAMPRRART